MRREPDSEEKGDVRFELSTTQLSEGRSEIEIAASNSYERGSDRHEPEVKLGVRFGKVHLEKILGKIKKSLGFISDRRYLAFPPNLSSQKL